MSLRAFISIYFFLEPFEVSLCNLHPEIAYFLQRKKYAPSKKSRLENKSSYLGAADFILSVLKDVSKISTYE